MGKKDARLAKVSKASSSTADTKALLSISPAEAQKKEWRRKAAMVCRILGAAAIVYGSIGALYAQASWLNSYTIYGMLFFVFAGFISYLDDPRMDSFRFDAIRREAEEKLRKSSAAEQEASKKPRPCVLCNKTFVGFGHDAQPITVGLCCDACLPKVTRRRADMSCAKHDNPWG